MDSHLRAGSGRRVMVSVDEVERLFALQQPEFLRDSSLDDLLAECCEQAVRLVSARAVFVMTERESHLDVVAFAGLADGLDALAVEARDVVASRRLSPRILYVPVAGDDGPFGWLCAVDDHADALDPAQLRRLKLVSDACSAALRVKLQQTEVFARTGQNRALASTISAKQAELALLQGRLAEADRHATVAVLAAGIAHEIKNPLAFVLSNLEYALEELSTASVAEEVLHSLSEAKDGAKRILTISRAFLSLSRPTAAELSPTSVNEVVQMALQLARPKLRDVGAVNVSLCPDLEDANANSTELAQVVLNLAMNAADAMAASPKEARSLSIRTFEAGARIVIEVSDNGCGMSAAVKERLFEPFFTTKPVGEGNGLGLSVSRKLIHGMGGALELDSEVGRGTTFRIALPRWIDASN